MGTSLPLDPHAALVRRDLRALAYTQGSRFEAAFDEPRQIQLDGDGFGEVRRVRISVLPGALLIRTNGEGSPTDR